MRKNPPLAVLLGASLLLATDAAPRSSPENSYRLVEDLMSSQAGTRKTAREKLIASRDSSLAAALVEVVFFSSDGRADAIAVLESLLGEQHGRNFKKWVETIGRREDITPKKGYAGFKARQYARIDPALAEFLREEFPRTIRVEEIVFGGVKKDGIPALRNPRHIAGTEAGFLRDDEKVFGVSINGDARAYPLRILDWHEMVNDVIGNTAVSLSYCTLCGSAILYSTTLGNGETYTFGSSGLLYRSNKLMYDHQTDTLWSNLTGEPVMGPLVGKGRKLSILPMTTTTWGEWRKRHPGTRVLSLDTGFRRDYRPGAAYGGYFSSEELMFPVWKKAPAILKDKDWIYAIEIDGRRKVYALKDLIERPLINDAVAGKTITFITDPKSEAVRAYLTLGARFEVATANQLREEKTGALFRAEEEALVSLDGQTRFARIPGHLAYWFGWNAFFPGTELYRPSRD